jgi:hypothetical protein
MRTWWIAGLTAVLVAAGGGAATPGEGRLRPEGAPVLETLRRARPVDRAQVAGKYSGLLHRFDVPEDRETYGEFHDYGYWAGGSYRGVTGLPAGYWVYVAPTWFIWREQRALRPAVIESVAEARRRSWGPEQATGEPDTLTAGDLPTAWASRTRDDQEEWLDLRYARPVSPSAALVHATYNPGALIKMTAFTEDGREVTVWTGKDPAEPGSGRAVSVLPFRTDFATARIRIYLDSPGVPGWNEIDAVGLVDDFGRTQWAVAAEASSTYAADADPGIDRLAPLGGGLAGGRDRTDLAGLAAEVERLRAEVERLRALLREHLPR